MSEAKQQGQNLNEFYVFAFFTNEHFYLNS